MDPLQSALDASPDAVLVVNREGIVERANRHVTDILGYEPQEIEGMVVEKLLLEEDRESHVQFRQEYMADPEPRPMGRELDLYALCKDGTNIPVEISLGPIEQDGTRYVVATISDITKRKQREQELKSQYEQFRYVEDVADIGYWEIDVTTTDAHEPAGSQGVYDIYERADVEPMDIDEALEYYHPEDRPQIEQAVERVVSEGEPYDLELRLTTTKGSERWVHTVGEPVKEDGEIVAVRGIIQDITERKRHEQAVTAQNERLDQFAAVVSHDLRNPLRVAEAGLELARDECTSDHLERVDRALDRMDSLIEDLLTLARAGETVADFESVDLAALAEECWTTIETADATLVIDIERRITGDERRLRQLIDNLVRNAVEHGGEDVTVTVGELADGFYFEDDGTGIPAEEREEVFNTGYSTSDQGIGFGLNIVEQVVKAHDWEITVTDGSAGGARFEITGIAFADERSGD